MRFGGQLHRVAAAILMIALAAAAVLGEGSGGARGPAFPDATATTQGATGDGPASQGAVLFSANGEYAFPLAGNIGAMAWTHYHWNGGNAVDILPSPRLSVSSAVFRAFERSPVVAVTAGVVSRADNELGGTALVLRGDDRREYYYAHLSQTWVVKATRVRAGEILGIIGRSGRWTQYIERHLHFAITSRWHRGLVWKNDVNAAEWIRAEFGLAWIDQTPKPYPAAYPHGSPLRVPYRVIRTFAQMRAGNPDIASIELLPGGDAASGEDGGGVTSAASGSGGSAAGNPAAASSQIGVYSTLTGQIRVLRGTVLGLRIQVTNRHTNQTVVFSGLVRSQVQTGDVVKRGGLVGYTAGVIDYMYFDRGALVDPVPTMGGRG